MKEVLGGIVIAVGILIAGASGLCAVSALLSDGPDQYGIRTLAMFVGGSCFLIGIALAFGGRRLIRSARTERDGEGP